MIVIYRIDLDLLNQKKSMLEMILNKKIKHNVEIKDKDGNVTNANIITNDNEVKLLTVYANVIEIKSVYSATLTLFFEFEQRRTELSDTILWFHMGLPIYPSFRRKRNFQYRYTRNKSLYLQKGCY